MRRRAAVALFCSICTILQHVNVARPIASVIPSLDGAVLNALAGTTAPLNLSGVHALAGTGSLSGVRRVLVRLVEEGVVDMAPGGYVLNREHVAAPAIEALSRLWGEVLDRIRRLAESWSAPPALVALFGSAARRDGDSHSDIDLLLVSDAKDLGEQARELAARVSGWTGNTTMVLDFSSKDIRRMRRAREAILDEWGRDLLVVVGDRGVLRGGGR